MFSSHVKAKPYKKNLHKRRPACTVKAATSGIQKTVLTRNLLKGPLHFTIPSTGNTCYYMVNLCKPTVQTPTSECVCNLVLQI